MGRHLGWAAAWALGALVLGAALALGGCSVVKAAEQAPRKDLSVLDRGTPRKLVLLEFGQPAVSEKSETGRSDLYKFNLGFTSGERALRAFGHGTADFFTLGLWEIVGTPIETVWEGEDARIAINYDAQDRVSGVDVLRGNGTRQALRRRGSLSASENAGGAATAATTRAAP